MVRDRLLTALGVDAASGQPLVPAVETP
jgi:hypothetical protein